MKNIVVLASLALVVSCTSTKTVSIRTIEPSPVNLSNDIKRIGVIDTEGVDSELYTETSIHFLVDNENKWLNEKGRNEALSGLIEELQKDKRFQSISLLDSIPSSLIDFNSETDVAWNKVASICDTHGLDALFSLDRYEMETQISLKKKKIVQPNMMRVRVKVPGQEITLETLIENGWKIYYPKQRKIIDEFTFNDEIVSTAQGTDALQALRAAGDRRDSVLRRGRLSGNTYGKRLQPYQKQVERRYFAKGSSNFETAVNFVEAGDIQGASELWKRELNQDKSKLRGRACHNLAVGYEIEGKLALALDWARKAHEDLKNKSSNTYIQQLEHRIAGQEVLKTQQIADSGFVYE